MTSKQLLNKRILQLHKFEKRQMLLHLQENNYDRQQAALHILLSRNQFLTRYPQQLPFLQTQNCQ